MANLLLGKNIMGTSSKILFPPVVSPTNVANPESFAKEAKFSDAAKHHYLLIDILYP